MPTSGSPRQGARHLEPGDGDGRRRHRLDDPHASDQSSQAPHHPTQEWVDRIHAMHLFDDGYEKLRERIFANQKKLGVIAKDAKLEPWPADLITPGIS